MTILLALLLATETIAAPVAKPVPMIPPVTKPAAKPDRAHILAAVRAEWPHYDAGNKGKLTPLEFSTWVLRANGATVAEGSTKGQKGIRPVSAMNATSTAFGKADANHDGGVTMDEMVAFLAR
jgi:hypothetical protein